MGFIAEMLDDLRREVGEEWYKTICLAAIALELAGFYISLLLLEHALSLSRTGG